MYQDFVGSFVFTIPIIFGLTEFIKAQGVKGKAVTWVAFGLGVLYGTVVIVATLYPDYTLDPPTVLNIAAFLPAAGLVTSGFYKFLDARIAKNGEGVG